jgi:hypothetical protein
MPSLGSSIDSVDTLADLSLNLRLSASSTESDTACALSCDSNFLFSIDGHNFTVIEADGELTEPLVVDQLRIMACQRYSVVLVADKPVDNYWTRSLPNNLTSQGFAGGLNAAILRYQGGAPWYRRIFALVVFCCLSFVLCYVLSLLFRTFLPYISGFDSQVNVFRLWKFPFTYKFPLNFIWPTC